MKTLIAILLLAGSVAHAQVDTLEQQVSRATAQSDFDRAMAAQPVAVQRRILYCNSVAKLAEVIKGLESAPDNTLLQNQLHMNGQRMAEMADGQPEERCENVTAEDEALIVAFVQKNQGRKL